MSINLFKWISHWFEWNSTSIAEPNVKSLLNDDMCLASQFFVLFACQFLMKQIQSINNLIYERREKFVIQSNKFLTFGTFDHLELIPKFSIGRGIQFHRTIALEIGTSTAVSFTCSERMCEWCNLMLLWKLWSGKEFAINFWHNLKSRRHWIYST